jgi:hypothetical protein
MKRLDDAAARLMPVFTHVSIRGEGRSEFLYATQEGRSIELSQDDGGWWMEFWEASDDEYAGPVKESTVSTLEEAVQQISAWLSRRD